MHARRAVVAVFVTATFSLVARPAAAQKAHGVSSDPDMQAIANYRLTEANLRKFYKAQENVGKAAMKDPKLGDALENSMGDDSDIATMAAKYDHEPALKGALAAAGLTSREYVTITLSYMQAAMAYGMMTQGPENLRLKKLPEGTSKENVEFIRTHQALIEQLDKELKSLQPPG